MIGEKNLDKIDRIKTTMLGWDITDYGMGDFRKTYDLQYKEHIAANIYNIIATNLLIEIKVKRRFASCLDIHSRMKSFPCL